MGGEFKGMQRKFKGNIEHVAQASNYATTASVITHKYIKCKSRVAKCQIFLHGANLPNQVLPEQKCINQNNFIALGSYFWGTKA